MAEIEFHNDSARPLFVPGFHGLPVWAQLPKEKRFSHGMKDWAQPIMTARERAMLQLMEELTDKSDWHLKILQGDVVAHWRQEALAKPIISTAAWDWCVAELQDKAIQFQESAFAVVLNADCGVCKSDILVPTELQDELKHGTLSLLEAEEKDWYPDTDNQVLNLVHPSLYPLVYGRTEVLSNGGHVDLGSPMNSCGRGILTTEPILPKNWQQVNRNYGQWTTVPIDASEFWARDYDSNRPISSRFQWLPSEVEFTGRSNTEVRITSYINNLHPARHSAIYSTIEKMISLSCEPWNQILVKGGKGRWSLRINTWGVETQPEYPEWAECDHVRRSAEDKNSEEFKALCEKIDAYLAIPIEAPKDQNTGNGGGDHLWGVNAANYREVYNGCYRAVEQKWHELHHWLHPDPGVSFNYRQWKSGETHNAIIERASTYDPDDPGAPVKGPQQDHEYYNVALQEEFRTKGLQVHVRMSSVELTPDKPHFSGVNWQLEGLLNEHVVATSMYYYDVDNVTEPRLHFRQEIEMNSREFVHDEVDVGPLAGAFAVENLQGHDCVTGYPFLDSQYLGSVSTHEGRFLAWPNTLQHRLEPFELIDKEKPGHRRFIVLWLVDPHYRVCSTRNVPPQQYDWWREEAFASVRFEERKMPAELVLMVEDHLDEWPMGMTEAKRLRLDLLKEYAMKDEKLNTEWYQMNRRFYCD